MPPEQTTNLAMLERHVALANKDLLDVGCGSGVLARELAARGARVTGLEISEQQLGEARENEHGHSPVYVIGTAQAVPLGDASQDIVVFMNSLHHVPEPSMSGALHEAARLLRPGGLLYVAEPLAEGEFYAMVKLVENEDRVRAAAQEALARAGEAGLERATTVEYQVAGRLTDVAALRRRIVSVDPRRAERFDAHADELADAFAQLGEQRDGARHFMMPVRADVLVPAVS